MKIHLIAAWVFVASSLFAQDAATVDDTARLLAGLPVNGPLQSLEQSPGWQEHAAAMNEAWARKQRLQIGPISAWMQENAPQYYESTSTMFYMFSGPDALYANLFYPHANTYILAGLEPVGNVPDLTRMPPEVLQTDLAALRGSLSTVLRFQYFITKDMRAELGRGNISGTLPILYVFLSRLGYTVIDATRVTTPAEGVKITFANGDQPRQTLYYFKTDLSGGNSAFLKWCAQRGPGLSLLKAASYLMHTDGFGGVRNFLLEHSRVIIQDDSGIPLRAFPKNWTLHLYGRYVPHGDEFEKYNQPDLAALYARENPPELGFGFGYHWQKERGILMFATREAPRAILVEPAVNEGTARPRTSRPRRAAPPPDGARE